MTFDPFLVAGALSLFWTVWFFISALSPSTVTSLSASAGWSSAEAYVTWGMLASSFYVLAFAVFAMITYGIFNRKKWTEKLAMWGGGAVAVIWAILTIVIFFLSDRKMTGVTLLTIFGVVLGLALAGLLIWSVMKMRHQFTNP
jgi:hypothetical protein